ANRHNGPSAQETELMLAKVGARRLDQLIEETIPAHIRLKQELQTGEALSEQELLKHQGALADKNKVFKSYVGMGYYDTIVPGVILRNILENPGWYTQYTPYQAEIAQ